MATLKEYLNAKIKSKGSSFSKEKAKAKNYKSISAAKSAGALYYTNKAGKVMAAVYAEDLKSSPTKAESKSPGTGASIKKSERPKARPTKAEPKSSVLAPAKSDRPKTKAQVKSKAASTSSRKTILTSGQKPKKSIVVKPKKSTTTANERAIAAEIVANNKKIDANSKRRADTRKLMVENSTATRSRKRKKLTGAAWMATHTFADYMNLTRAEAKALGLPQTRLAAVGTKFMDASKYTFKDGKGFINIGK